MVMLVAPRVGPIFGPRAVLLLVIALVLSFVAIPLVGLRVYDARKHRRALRWDLIWVTAATALAIVLQLLCGLLACFNGLGTSEHLLSVNQAGLALMWSWYGVIIGIWTLVWGKLAIIALYLQITKEAARNERYFLWAMAMTVSVAGTVQTILLLTECRPTSHLWFRHKPGTCPNATNANNFGFFIGALAAFTDLVLALYPIPIVMNLTCSRRTKISICLVMGGGLLPFAAAVGRTINLRALKYPKNPTQEFIPLFIWAIIEQWMVIILGCLPPLRAYFARWIHLDSVPGSRRPSAAPLPGSQRKKSQANVFNNQNMDIEDAYFVTDQSEKFGSKVDQTILTKTTVLTTVDV